jgi:hypothetical protein
MAQTLSSLELWDTVRFGRFKVNSETTMPDISWVVVDKSTSGVTLLAEDIIAQLAFDAKEPNNPVSARMSYGNNYYKVSNIRQWLNSTSASWYSSQHSYDQSPNSDTVVSGGTQYASRPGFLYYFNTKERALLLATTQTTYNPPNEGASTSYTTADKVFLPSAKQLNVNDAKAEGSTWGGFTEDYVESDGGESVGEYRACGESDQLKANRVSTATSGRYFLRTVGANGSNSNIYTISSSTGVADGNSSPFVGNVGIRPAIVLASATLVDDNYKVIAGTAPTVPSYLNVPSTIKGGSTASISWGVSTDTDGDSVGYRLERSVNGGEYSVLYTGTATTYTDSITKGWNTVQYRVCAYDVDGDSAYSTSAKVTVKNNTSPTISGSDSNLGTKTDGVSVSYSVGDADGNTVTVTEALDGTTIRSFTATLGATNTLSITGEDWLTVTNGTHTITITAKDNEGASVTRTYIFSRSQYTCSVQTNPMSAASTPVRIKISVNSRVPVGATQRVYVCNNAYDTSPTWEDATEAVNNNLVYIFTNNKMTATKWGVAVKVTLARGDAEGSCYIKAIGGNFE